MNTPSPPRFVRRLRREVTHALDAYSVRFSLGLIASLLVVIGFTRLPLHEPPNRLGWGRTTSGERIQLHDLRTVVDDEAPAERSEASASDAPITRQSARPEQPADKAASSPDETEADGSGDADTDERRALRLTALGPAGQAPHIVGGRGSFYLRIHYPEAARRQGIEGRVVLDFVVDPDGVTRDIRVAQSLHPLCDSSAVAALRETRFVPARRNGKKVPVRMRLPVRFQLINYTANTADSRSPEQPPNPL